MRSHAALRTTLRARLDAIECALAGVDLPGTNGLGDDADHAAHSEARESAFARRERLLAEGDAIALALERLAAGQYGTCLDCGEAIGAKRLAVLPSAARCVTCEAAREREAARD